MDASLRDAVRGPHAPVLYQQALTALAPRAGGLYIDGTLGGGGHAQGILEASAPDGKLLGLDRDPAALAVASQRLGAFGPRVHLSQASFADMAGQAAALGWEGVDGILLDLGLSSMQLDDPGRGFSLRLEGPLDMRFDPAQSLTAAEVVNGWSEDELAGVLRRFGELPRSRAIARAIVRSRPLRTTVDLAQVVAQAAGRSRSRIHPATQAFQALRLAVNGELEALAEGLEASLEVLNQGGRLVVIAFHSLEDRIVKQFLRRESRDCVCPPQQPVCTCGHVATLHELHRRPLRPTRQEVTANPRARSARLRAAERMGKARSLHSKGTGSEST